MHQLVAIIFSLFLAFALVSLSAAIGRAIRGRPAIAGISAVPLALLLSALLGGQLGSAAPLAAFPLAILLVTAVVCAFPDKRPRCRECGGLLVKGARICRFCGEEAQTADRKKKPSTSGRPAQKGQELAECPHCHKGIPVSQLKEGANRCPFCGGTFKCS